MKKGIGETLRESVINSIRREYEQRSKQTEIEMELLLTKQKEMQIETERSKFAAKLDSLRLQLKNDHDKILKVEIRLQRLEPTKNPKELVACGFWSLK